MNIFEDERDLYNGSIRGASQSWARGGVFAAQRTYYLWNIYATPKRVVVERRYFSTTPREGMYVLLRNKRYREMTPKHLLRPVLQLPKYETLY